MKTITKALIIIALLAACGEKAREEVVEVPVSVVIVDETGSTINVQDVQAEVDAINACTAEWDGYVNEWNALSDAERDATTYDAWAAEKGYPLTYEEHCA